jgi:hypothetical protein
MARKLSQLPLANAISDTDKFLMTRSSSGNSEAVSATAFKAYLSTAPAEANNILYVAPNGDDLTGGGLIDNPYKTINHAISQISGSSIVNRYVIECAPGIYAEDPIVLPQYVGINGKTNSSVTIIPNDINSPLISLGDFSTLSNLTINGVSNSIGVQMLTAGRTSIRTVTIANCNTGMYLNNASSEIVMSAIIILTNDPTGTSIKVDAGTCQIASVSIPKETDVLSCVEVSGSSSKVIVDGITINESAVGSVLKANSGATIYLMSSTILGDGASPIGKFVDASGVGTSVHLNGVEVSYCDICVLADDGADLDLISVDARNCGTVIEIGATGSNTTITLVAMSFRGSTNLDMNLLSSTAKIIGTANVLADDKINITPGAVLNVSHYSTTSGDEGFSIKGELHVGSPDFPSETCLGEGDSYTRGLLAYTFDGASYVDISADVKSNTGSTFTFPNSDVGSAIYISSDLVANGTMDYHKFLGFKNSMTVAQVGGSIIAEYWNGATWTEVKTVTCQSSDKYYRQANRLFTAIAGNYQVLLNPNICDDWAKNDDPSVDANDRYWIRLRIDSVPSTLPVFEQFKLHSSRTEYNSDGYQEYFGLARPYVAVPVPWNTFQDAGSTVSNQDLWLSSNTPVGFSNNSFDTAGDSVGAITSLPSWVDTSAPLKVRVSLVAEVSGSATFVATLNSSNDGSIISQADPASTVGEIQDTKVLTLVQDEQQWVEFEIDVSNIGIEADGKFPDSIWINVEKTVGTPIVNGMQFELLMLKFRDGGHI